MCEVRGTRINCEKKEEKMKGTLKIFYTTDVKFLDLTNLLNFRILHFPTSSRTLMVLRFASNVSVLLFNSSNARVYFLT